RPAHPAGPSAEGDDDRSVIARAELAARFGATGPIGQRAARQDVVDAPPDVALPEVAPRRPPGEQLVVVGIERPSDVDQPFIEERREPLAFFGTRTNLVRLPLLRMDVAFLAGHVEVATQQ